MTTVPAAALLLVLPEQAVDGWGVGGDEEDGVCVDVRRAAAGRERQREGAAAAAAALNCHMQVCACCVVAFTMRCMHCPMMSAAVLHPLAAEQLPAASHPRPLSRLKTR